MEFISKIKYKINYKLSIVFAAVLAMTLVSCGEEINKPNLVEANHRVVYTSEQNFGNTIQVGGSIDLSDVSQGIESRKWEFPTGDVSVNAGLDNYLLTAVYNEAGVHDVNLTQKFKSDAYTEQGSVPVSKTLDTTIVVTVLDSIKSDVKAYYVNSDSSTGAELVLENGAKNQLEAGEYVRFISVSSGVPATNIWTAEGARPSEPDAVEVDVKYSSLGIYDVSFEAKRTRPFGVYTESYTDYIEVIPSSKPLALDKLTAVDQQLAMAYSRDIDPATINASDYSVVITPAAGGTITPTVESVKLDPSNPSNILLILAGGEKIYSDDNATVTYTPGVVASVDGALAPAETNVPLEQDYVNILETQGYDYDMENPNVSWATDVLFLKGGDHTVAKSTSQAHSGTTSVRVEIDPASGGNSVSTISSYNSIDSSLHTFNLEAGKTYKLDAWIYIEQKGGTFNNNAKFFVLDAAANEDWAKFPHVFYPNAATEGVWTQLQLNPGWPETIWESVGGDFQVVPHFINGNTGGSLIYYLDDITIYEWNERP